MRQFDLFWGRWRSGLSGSGLWIDSPQHLVHYLILRLLIDIVDIDVADNPCLIDNEDSPF
jgi:hypothetical protein